MKKARDPPKRGKQGRPQDLKDRKIAAALTAQRLKISANATYELRKKLYHLLRLPSSQNTGK